MYYMYGCSMIHITLSSCFHIEKFSLFFLLFIHFHRFSYHSIHPKNKFHCFMLELVDNACINVVHKRTSPFSSLLNKITEMSSFNTIGIALCHPKCKIVTKWCRFHIQAHLRNLQAKVSAYTVKFV